jgi:predicted nuclease of predicted toxin-antitoxin system
MRFLVDECTGPAVARWLREQGHQVFSVYEEARGMEDDEIIGKAFTENRVLVTNDIGIGVSFFCVWTMSGQATRWKRPRCGCSTRNARDLEWLGKETS